MFPCVLRIMPEHIFNMKDPIIVGVEVLEGIAKVGTLLCVPSKGKITIGKIWSRKGKRKAASKGSHW